MELYKGIAGDDSLSQSAKEEKHEKIYNSTWNETTQDDLYWGYHDFFTKTKQVPNPAYVFTVKINDNTNAVV